MLRNIKRWWLTRHYRRSLRREQKAQKAVLRWMRSLDPSLWDSAEVSHLRWFCQDNVALIDKLAHRAKESVMARHNAVRIQAERDARRTASAV